MKSDMIRIKSARYAYMGLSAGELHEIDGYHSGDVYFKHAGRDWKLGEGEYEFVSLKTEDKQKSEKASATTFLSKALSLLEERGKDYDQEDGERSMGKTVDAFNIITGKDLTESEGWLLLQLLKDVRQWSKEEYHADSAEDCISYAALKAEALAEGK